jgi:hypothetical protein
MKDMLGYLALLRPAILLTRHRRGPLRRLLDGHSDRLCIVRGELEPQGGDLRRLATCAPPFPRTDQGEVR